MKIYFTAEYDPVELKPLYNWGEVILWMVGHWENLN